MEGAPFLDPRFAAVHVSYRFCLGIPPGPPNSVTAAPSSPSEGYSTPQAPPQPPAGGLQVDFESVFGNKAGGGSSLNPDGEDLI